MVLRERDSTHAFARAVGLRLRHEEDVILTSEGR